MLVSLQKNLKRIFLVIKHAIAEFGLPESLKLSVHSGIVISFPSISLSVS